MGMLAARVNVQTAKHFPAETVFGQHALDGFLHNVGRPPLQQVACRLEPLSTGIARVEEVIFVGQFAACKPHLVCIDHDDVIAAVYVWGERRLVLSTKHAGYLARKATHNLCFGIYEIPTLLNRLTVGRDSFVT